MGQGLIIENSRSHTDTPHSIGLLWTSVQPSTNRTPPDNTQHSQETEIHAPAGIRTNNPRKRVAADRRLKTARPSGSAFLHISQYKFRISPSVQKKNV